MFEPNDTHAAPKSVEALVRELIEQVLFTNLANGWTGRASADVIQRRAFTQKCESKVSPGK